MRLTQDQVSSLIVGLDPFIQNDYAELRLFGSRINDELKGGDIDLLILTEHLELAESLLELKHRVLANIKKYVGDQKIDLTIAAKQDVQQDAFLKMIVPGSIVLNIWNPG